MMVDPHDQDREEAGHEREVRGPLICERLCEGRRRRQVMRQLDVENQKSDGDGEYAVAERLDPRRFVETARHRGALVLPITVSSATRRALTNVRFATAGYGALAPYSAVTFGGSMARSPEFVTDPLFGAE